jgi:glycosyltransferase involved in cell wall biosynthesis
MSSGPIRVLELRSVRGTGGGPEKTILNGALRSDPAHVAVTVCYIRDRRDDVFAINEHARRLGVDYIEILEDRSFDWKVFGQLRRLIRARQIDIVHAHEYKTDFLALLLARFERVIPLSTVHGWSGFSAKELRFYYPCDKRLLARYPRVIAVSNKIKQELVRHGAHPERVNVVLNGIDHTKFYRLREQRATIRHSLGFSDTDFVIGTVGRIEREKRFDILVNAFAALAKRNPALRLVIAGDGSLRQEIERQVANIGLSSSCSFLGQRTDVVELHSAFDLFVQSSDTEGTPNSVLEAMACETPIVATAAGGTAELTRHRQEALIVEPGDTSGLTAAIAECVQDGPDVDARVRAGRERIVAELSFDARMARVEAIYHELAASRKCSNITSRPQESIG